MPAHEKFTISGQAMRLPTSWPSAHQMERTVRRYWCDAGTNSVRHLRQLSRAKSHRRFCARTEEDGRVDGQVSADAYAPHGDERTQREQVRRATRREREGAREEERDVERPSDVRCSAAGKPRGESSRDTHLRPQTSEARPQKAAPMRKPMACPSLIHAPEPPNSAIVGVRIRFVTI